MFWVWDENGFGENVIGRNHFWMKVSLDETVFQVGDAWRTCWMRWRSILKLTRSVSIDRRRRGRRLVLVPMPESPHSHPDVELLDGEALGSIFFFKKKKQTNG